MARRLARRLAPVTFAKTLSRPILRFSVTTTGAGSVGRVAGRAAGVDSAADRSLGAVCERPEQTRARQTHVTSLILRLAPSSLKRADGRLGRRTSRKTVRSETCRVQKPRSCRPIVLVKRHHRDDPGAGHSRPPA